MVKEAEKHRRTCPLFFNVALSGTSSCEWNGAPESQKRIKLNRERRQYGQTYLKNNGGLFQNCDKCSINAHQSHRNNANNNVKDNRRYKKNKGNHIFEIAHRNTPVNSDLAK